MKFVAGIMLVLLAAVPAAVQSGNKQIHCIVGPVEKIYGGTKWLVHSCDDGKSLVFTAKAGPAVLFEFDLTYTGNGYDLDGKGKAKGNATDAAYADLQKLRAADILKLLQETQRVKRD